MFHVCIFTDNTNEKFISVGGFTEAEIHQNLASIVAEKYTNRNFNKLVIFKSFLMDQEGETYLALISKFEHKDLSKLVLSENVSYSDLSKHLADT